MMSLPILAVVWIAVATSSPIQNKGTLISSGRPTKQSSTYDDDVSSLAVDGNTDGSYKGNSCSHTQNETMNWWRVDFDSNYTVFKVVVYNRKYSVPDRINGAMVYAGDEYCGAILYKQGQVIYSIDCNKAVAGSVTIKLPNNYLNLCEVEVYGEESEKSPLKNIALNKKTCQSTTYYNMDSEKAVDGNAHGVYGSQSCSHTWSAGQQWWMVQLEHQYLINKVVIHNRVDACPDRINGIKVLVDEQECGVITYETGQQVYVVNCNKTGSSVKAQVSDQYLTLCEVEVLADAKTSDDGILISSGRPTKQSSTYLDDVSSLAVDGNTEGSYYGNSCSHTQKEAMNWWRVDFDSNYTVFKVVVYNRKYSVAADRINGAMVYVGDKQCGTIEYKEGQSIYNIDCNKAVGGAVTIKLPNNYLTLCEVEVYGLKSEQSNDTCASLKYRL